MLAAIIPPTIAHAQQQMLGIFTKGIAERIPRITPPINAGFILSFMSVYTFTWEKIEKLRFGVSVSPAGRLRDPRPRRRTSVSSEHPRHPSRGRPGRKSCLQGVRLKSTRPGTMQKAATTPKSHAAGKRD